MLRERILQQIIEWIESNLELPVSIDDIAQKSGYSRRNIQLLFRNFMHMPLGAYIRKRRLCRAAILVRLTTKSMLSIALSLHFDSQQSFSREFKKQFGCTPREYRYRNFWNTAYILPPALKSQYKKTHCTLVHLSEIHLLGDSFKYDIILSNTASEEEKKFRRNYLSRYLKKAREDIYCISTFKPSRKSEDYLTIETFAGAVRTDTDNDTLTEWVTSGGVYASFHYEGDWEHYANWVRGIYLTELPDKGLVRVNGYDIELFYYNKTFTDNDSNYVTCDIFIPVKSAMSHLLLQNNAE